MLVVGLRFAQPLVRVAWKEGSLRLGLSVILIAFCALTIIALKISVIPVLLVTAVLGMLFFTSWRSPAKIAANRAGTEEEIHD